MNRAEQRERIADLLRADPTRSDRSVAVVVGVSPTTVGAVRASLGLDSSGARRGLDGKVRRVDRQGQNLQQVEAPRISAVPAEAEAQPQNRLHANACGRCGGLEFLVYRDDVRCARCRPVHPVNAYLYRHVRLTPRTEQFDRRGCTTCGCMLIWQAEGNGEWYCAECKPPRALDRVRCWQPLWAAAPCTWG